MNEILIRFKVVKNNRIIEAYLDRRLSFNSNFKYLSKISNYSLINYKVYDPNKKIFLDCDVPIETFSINSFMLFYLF